MIEYTLTLSDGSRQVLRLARHWGALLMASWKMYECRETWADFAQTWVQLADTSGKHHHIEFALVTGIEAAADFPFVTPALPADSVLLAPLTDAEMAEEAAA